MTIHYDLIAQHQSRHANILKRLVAKMKPGSKIDLMHVSDALPPDIYSICVQSFVERLAFCFNAQFNELFDRKESQGNRVEWESVSLLTGNLPAFLFTIEEHMRDAGFAPESIIWTKAPLFIIVSEKPLNLKLSESVVRTLGVKAAYDAVSLLDSTGRLTDNTPLALIEELFCEVLPAVVMEAQSELALSQVSMRVCAFIKEQMQLGDSGVSDDEREEALHFGRALRSAITHNLATKDASEMTIRTYFTAVGS